MTSRIASLLLRNLEAERASWFPEWTLMAAPVHRDPDSSNWNRYLEDEMPTEGSISREHAIELARARHDESWRPVPGCPFGDTMARSYRMERYRSGWIFTPTVAGLDRDPRLGEHYPFYVVEDSGAVWRSPHAKGTPV
jgi:hypothetical protein